MLIRHLFLPLLTVIILHGSAWASDCVKYGVQVEISGFYGEVVFPGPPNYENVRAGDASETASFLFLENAICISAGGDEMELAIASTRVIQLSCPSYIIGLLRDAAGKLSKVRGSLFAAHTAHHRTSALIACGD